MNNLLDYTVIILTIIVYSMLGMNMFVIFMIIVSGLSVISILGNFVNNIKHNLKG